MSGTPALFSPLQVGAVKVQHRIVLAPLTRYRANAQHEPTALGLEYYTQRAGTPGTLRISEGALIAPQVGAFPNTPGLWSDTQLASWKKITDSMHARGSFIFAQLWAIGRHGENMTGDTEGRPLVSASDIPLAGHPAPRALAISEIAEYVQLYATAAKNAVERAGFDGVEIPCANGFLIDQFLQTNSNKRTDAYGGSLEGRLRFALEVTDAVTAAVGADRTGVRIGPWSRIGDAHGRPLPTFVVFVDRLKTLHPNIAYLHVIEPRVVGNTDEPAFDASTESNKVIRDTWGARPYIAAGGLIAFGRDYISNPDLPLRLKKGITLAAHNRHTFYTAGPVGYMDYPFACA